jgi:hypothetical protein
LRGAGVCQQCREADAGGGDRDDVLACCHD